jgi:hypothetical protein
MSRLKVILKRAVFMRFRALFSHHENGRKSSGPSWLLDFVHGLHHGRGTGLWMSLHVIEYEGVKKRWNFIDTKIEERKFTIVL